LRGRELNPFLRVDRDDVDGEDWIVFGGGEQVARAIDPA
jgi:hypothetical protein